MHRDNIKFALPNFLIIGAAKSGTGALHHYLAQHPEIFMSPIREPHFFALEGTTPVFQGPQDDELINKRAVTTLEEYTLLFSGVQNEIAVGESSVSTLYSAKAPARIKNILPCAKLIVILRNPVDRAFSNYLYMVARGFEPEPTFEAAIKVEEWRIQNGWQHIWHYRNMGFYGEQLERFVCLFPLEQKRIFLYEDFLADSQTILRSIFEFLEVDTTFRPRQVKRPNQSGIPKNQYLNDLLLKHGLLKQALKILLPKEVGQVLASEFRKQNLRKPRLDRATRLELIETYQPDIERLQRILNRDLSRWLT